MLNELLHAIVARLGHPSESSAEELHALVDVAAPVAPTAMEDAPADTADGFVIGTDDTTKGK